MNSDFLRGIAAALTGAGVPTEYEHPNLCIGKLRIYCWETGRRSWYVLGRRFLKTQSLHAMQMILERLPTLLEEHDEHRKRELDERTMGPIRMALQEIGLLDKSNKIQADYQYEALSILLMYARIKGLNIAHDRSALLQATLSYPGDRTPYMMYCDWLDENGHEADAIKLRDAMVKHEW